MFAIQVAFCYITAEAKRVSRDNWQLSREKGIAYQNVIIGALEIRRAFLCPIDRMRLKGYTIIIR